MQSDLPPSDATSALLARLQASEQRQRFLLALGDRLRALADPEEIMAAAAAALGEQLASGRAGYAEVDDAEHSVRVHRHWYGPSLASLAGSKRGLDAYGAVIDTLRDGRTFVADDAAVEPRAHQAFAQVWQAMGVRSAVIVPLVKQGRLRAVLYVHDAQPRGWQADEVALVEEVAGRTWDAVERARLFASLEQRVQAATEERDRLWRHSPDLLVVVSPGGLFLAANPAWRDVLGYEPHEVVGHHFREFVHPEDLPGSHAAIATALTVGSIASDNRYRHKDGSYRWIAWNRALDNGAVYAVGRHITEHKRQAESLRQVEAALRQAQKMEAVGQLTGGIAHDFNNLLQAIRGHVELIRRTSSDATVLRWADGAARAVERGAQLTSRLLAFSRTHNLDLKPLAVDAAVSGLRDLLGRTLGTTVDVQLQLAAPHLWVQSDATQFELALLNLAINARDAMPGGGVLLITTQPMSADGQGVLPTGDYVELAVSDTGSGMSAAVRERAFDPFFTTKEVGKGTGLGLSQVYGFAQQAGGGAAIDSVEGVGTTVRMWLRRCAPAAATPCEQDAEIDSGCTGQRLLLVDDDETVRCVVAETLHSAGYRVQQAGDGAQALRLLDDTAPDLLLLDFAMPGMNGAELAREALRRRPGTPVLFCTGYADADALRAAVGAQAVVLRKPFGSDALLALVREMLGRTLPGTPAR